MKLKMSMARVAANAGLAIFPDAIILEPFRSSGDYADTG
jgi:hypothetical protein